MWGNSFSTVEVSTAGDNISTVGGSISTVEGIQCIGRYLQFMRGDNISTVEGIQYSGGKFLILACLAITNDEKISIFFCITKPSFYSEVSKILADFTPF